MALVEIYDAEDSIKPIFVAEFDLMPRVGEHLAREKGGYFEYYDVVKIWHRQDDLKGAFRACALVALVD